MFRGFSGSIKYGLVHTIANIQALMIYTTHPSASFSIVRPVVHRHDMSWSSTLLGQGVVALRWRFGQATLSRLENSLGWPSTGKLEWWSVVDLQLANFLGFKVVDSCDWSCDAGSIDAILKKLWVVRTPNHVAEGVQVHAQILHLHILTTPILKKLYLQMLCRKTCG